MFYIYIHVVNTFNLSPLDKITVILTGGISKCIFLKENDRIPIQISLKFALSGPIENKPALVQVMV